jgi:large subunit ribosomal protein L18
MAKSNQSTLRRKARVRRAIVSRADGRPRLSVFRSSKQISTLEKTFREALKTGANVEAAKRIGVEIAERAKKAGVAKVVFDRGAYMYHGRVKALAEGAREGGLEF